MVVKPLFTSRTRNPQNLSFSVALRYPPIQNPQTFPESQMVKSTPTISSLCQRGAQTCGACCWGVNVNRTTLVRRLRRHRISFQRVATTKRYRHWRLLCHEVRVHRGMNLIWAVLLRLPWTSQRLKRHLAKEPDMSVCWFRLGQRSTDWLYAAPDKASRFRHSVALSLFDGFPESSVVTQTMSVMAAINFDGLPPSQQAAFTGAVRDMDWFDYTNTVRAFSCGHAGAVVAASRSFE